MPEILLAGSAPWELGFSPAVARPVTSSAVLDSDFTVVASEFHTPGPPPIIVDPRDPADSVWARFRWNPVGTDPTPPANLAIFAAKTSSGAVIAQIGTAHARTLLRATVYGNSTVSGPYDVGMFLRDTPGVYDFNIESAATEYVARFYLDGMMVGEVSAPKTAPSKIARAEWRVPRDSVAHSSRDIVLSEVLLTADIPTVGVRLAQMIPDGAGFYSDMPGSFADIIGDTENSIVGTLSGQRFSWTPSAYGASGNPGTIAAVVANTTAAHWLGEPDSFNAFLRIDGTDYDGSTLRPGVRNRHQSAWWTNPDTGLPWTPADLAGFEAGFRVTD